jgi:dTDP-4-amino-4,6-dideoxygalactose transaminase
LAFGSKYQGKTVGTFGKASYYSFQWNKPYTTGLGGMAVVNDEELAKKIVAICESQMVEPSSKEVLMLAVQLAAYRAFVYPRTTALLQDLFRQFTNKGVVVGSWTVGEFTSPEMPSKFFKGMSAVQAYAGLKQLRKIEQNIAHRKKMAQLYDKLLGEKGWRSRSYDASATEPVMVRYPVRITEKNKAIEKATAVRVELGSWFDSPLHPRGTPLAAYAYEPGMCPESEKAAREVVNLPLHPRVNEKTVRKTVEFITGYTEVV